MIFIMNILATLALVSLVSYVLWGICYLLFEKELLCFIAKIAVIIAMISTILCLFMLPFIPEEKQKTECSYIENIDYNYCPYCGKEIK